MTIARSILFALILASSCQSGLGQGPKPFDATSGGGVDSVSLTTGSLSLSIPLASFPQRGKLDLSFFIRYNTPQWQHFRTCTPNPDGAPPTCTTSWLPGPGYFGAELTSSTDWHMSYLANSITGGLSAQSPDGGQHWMDGGTTSTCSGCITTPLYPTHSLDGTGLLATNGTTLIQPNGAVFGFSTDVTTAGASTQAASVTDANGNRITVNSSGWNDTVGRSIPGSTLNCNNPNSSASCLPSIAPGIQAGIATSDLSNCPGGTSSARVWNVPGVGGTTRTFRFCYSSVHLQTSFGGVDFEFTGSATMLTAVVLPDLTLWTISYDSYGGIAQIGLPTGGSVSYAYVNNGVPVSSGINIATRTVTQRTVNANDGAGGHTTQYAYSARTVNSTGTQITFTVTVTSPDGNDIVDTVTNPVATSGLITTGDVFVTQSQYFQGSSSTGTPLKTTSTQYNGSLRNGSLINVVPGQTTTALPGGQTTKVVPTYPPGLVQPDGTPVVFATPIEMDEYDFSGALARVTLVHYLWQDNASYKNANFLSLVASTTIKDGSGNQAAQTTYAYDEGGVASSGVATGFVGAPAGALRGNLTTTSHFLNTAGGSVSGHATYFDTGMPASGTDALGNQTTYTYSSTCAVAYQTQVQAPTTNGVQHVTSGAYDCPTGLLSSSTDQNGQPSYYNYDIMLRPTLITAPDGGQTTFSYPNPTTIQTCQKIDSGRTRCSTALADGLGRAVQAQLSTPSGTVFVDTTYDVVGRVASVTNPFYSTSDPTYGVTRSQYDALGRVTKTVKADGSSSTAQYTDNCVTASDEAGKPHKGCSDALGRLIEVDEPGGITPATKASGSLTITGTLQTSTSSGPATSGHVELTFSGALQSRSSCTPSGQACTDSGSITVTVAGFSESAAYSSAAGTTPDAALRAIASAFHSTASSPVDTFYSGADESGNFPLDLTARAKGAATNYPLSVKIVSSNPSNFTPPSFQVTGPSSLFGGQDAASSSGGTVYDSGVVYVSVGSFMASAPYSQSGNSTAAMIASALVAPGPNSLNQASSPVNATASGATISMTYKAAGSAGNVFCSLTSSTANPDSPSFASPGTTLTGGADAQPGSLATPYVTLYTYDTLGNLLGVSQKGDGSQPRVRSFSYDSLSRLLSSTNPETGTLSYTYDNDGNVLTKIAPAPNQTATATVTTTYQHDALNRLTQKSYSDGTPAAIFIYDAPVNWGSPTTNVVGRLSYAYAPKSTGNTGITIFGYDPVGRINVNSQCTPMNCGVSAFSVGYNYNLAGAVTSYSTGAGFVFSQSYDAAGRLAQITSSLSDVQHPGTLLTVDPSSGYYASGGSHKFTFGNGLTETSAFNTRLQPCRTNLNSSSSVLSNCSDPIPSGNVQDFQYGFNAGANDNGNVVSFIATGNQNFDRGYAYDALNRLQAMSAPGESCSGLSWSYDAWGNRSGQSGSDTACLSFAASSDSRNRLAGAPYHYDAAGNLVNDGNHTYTYDAENRVVQVDGGNTATYSYDALGHRVEKATPAGAIDYVYDLGGRVVAEFFKNVGGFTAGYVYAGSSLVAVYKDNTTYFVHPDNLGSTRLMTNVDGSLHDSIDYLPFGEQTAGGFGMPHKFTGIERDLESGLDHFDARNYSSNLGRFTTPDWSAAPDPIPFARLTDPQSLNLYSYAANAPTRNIDPSGHRWIYPIGPLTGGLPTVFDNGPIVGGPDDLSDVSTDSFLTPTGTLSVFYSTTTDSPVYFTKTNSDGNLLASGIVPSQLGQFAQLDLMAGGHQSTIGDRIRNAVTGVVEIGLGSGLIVGSAILGGATCVETFGLGCYAAVTASMASAALVAQGALHLAVGVSGKGAAEASAGSEALSSVQTPANLLTTIVTLTFKGTMDDVKKNNQIVNYGNLLLTGRGLTTGITGFRDFLQTGRIFF